MSHLPSKSWRPRKAGGVVLVQIQRLENQGSQWYKSQSKFKGVRTGSTIVQGQKIDEAAKEDTKLTLPLPFLFY